MTKNFLSQKWREFIKSVGVFAALLAIEVVWIMFLIWLLSSIPVFGVPLICFVGAVSAVIIYYLISLVQQSYCEWKAIYE